MPLSDTGAEPRSFANLCRGSEVRLFNDAMDGGDIALLCDN